MAKNKKPVADKSPNKPTPAQPSSADPADPASAALAVVQEFLRLSFDNEDVEAARKLLCKSSLEGSQFNPSDMKGASYSIGTPTTEGEGPTQKIIVPTTVTPPADSGQPGMTVPLTLALEDGNWRIDLISTMDRLFGGSMQSMVNQLGTAMGEAMQGLGNAMGEALGGALGGMSEALGQGLGGGSTPTTPKLPPEDIAKFEQETLARDLETFQSETDTTLTVDIDYAAFLQSDDDQTNRHTLQRLADVWRPLEYALRQIHTKIPLTTRLAVLRIEPAPTSKDRIIFSEPDQSGKIIYRCAPLGWEGNDNGTYSVDEMENILVGVVAGMPDPIDPRFPPQKGPAAWMNDDGATLEEKYRAAIFPELEHRLSDLMGRQLDITMCSYDIGTDPDMLRGIMQWGLSRVVGAAALLTANPAVAEMVRDILREVVFTSVEGAAQHSVDCSGPSIRLYLALREGEAGNFYEYQIAEAVSHGLMLHERPVIDSLHLEIATWEENLLKTFRRPIAYQVDWPGFCSNPDTGKNMFALTLLREHGIDHLYYAVSGLAEKNPNFAQQFASRVATLRIVSVDSPAKKFISAEDGAIIVGLYLHEGYQGYFIIKDLEKQISAAVAKLPDAGYEKLAADHREDPHDTAHAHLVEPDEEESDDSDDTEAVAQDSDDTDEDDDSQNEYAQAADAAQSPQARALAEMRTQIEQTLPIYAQQMLAIVGKAIAIDMDWPSLSTTDQLGNLLNLGLSPVLAGVMLATSANPALKSTLTSRISRILLRATTDPTRQGFSIEDDKFIYTLILNPALSPMDPQLASTLIQTTLTTPTKSPAPRAAKPAPSKKPDPKKPSPKSALPKKYTPSKPAPKSTPAKKPAPKKKGR